MYNSKERREELKEVKTLKEGIVALVAKDLDITEERVLKVLNSIFKAIAKEVKSDKQVVISGFGTFIPKHVGEKMNYNPKKKEFVRGRPRTFVRFKPGKDLFPTFH